MNKYFTKHPTYNAVVHLVAGIGIGMMLTFPVAGAHPVRWGMAFLAIALVGHLLAWRK